MSKYQYITYDVDDYLATLTLNNPQKLNAWTPRMDLEIRDAMASASVDEAVRAIIITGAGRGFCAGGDMELLQANANTAGESTAEGMASDDLIYMTRIPKPIFAAINGAAVGIGAAFAIFSDYRFIADHAKISTRFARRGLVAEFGIAWLLGREVGVMNAIDLLSGRMISGVEAGQMGFARTLPAEDFLQRVTDFARELAKNTSPRSFGIVKKQLYDSFTQTMEEARDYAHAEAFKSFASEDCKEGVAYFVEKRPPAFTGR